MAQTPKLSSRDKPKATKRPPASTDTRRDTRSKTKRPAEAEAVTRPEITAESRRQMIEEAAYFRAEKRGFTSGDPANDWLIAEEEIDQLLAARAAPTAQ
jgi:hypothetical protein